LRVSLAIVFIILYLTNMITGTVGYILLGLSAVLLLTSIFGICPVYAIFGINTGKKTSA
jgi:hypothetical protein